MSSIRPQANDNNDVINKPTATIRVGNFATNPVLKYAVNTGMNITPDNNNTNVDIIPKKESGL